jgi:hypothetical protein
MNMDKHDKPQRRFFIYKCASQMNVRNLPFKDEVQTALFKDPVHTTM